MTLIWIPEIANEKCEFLLEGESERGIKHRDRAGSIKMQEWRLLARKNVAKIKNIILQEKVPRNAPPILK